VSRALLAPRSMIVRLFTEHVLLDGQTDRSQTTRSACLDLHRPQARLLQLPHPLSLRLPQPASPGDSSNPLKGKSFYANPYYASEIISLASPSLVAAGSTALAAKATNVAKVGTFYWL
jgi:hypothetical protein